jgi:Ca2+-binding RTX toxin-like protein
MRNEGTLAQPVNFGGDGAAFRNLGTITAPVTLVHDPFNDTSGVTFVNRGSGSVTAQLTGSTGPDKITGAGFTGTAHGDLGNDTLRGGIGDDTFYGGLGADYLQGRGGHDLLDGDGGTNSGAAAAGNDTLIGNAGNDTLLGGAGSDVLNGGKGDDSLTGGSDADTFVMRRVGNGDDQITDFQNGIDVIDISDLGLTGGYGDITGTPGALSEANGALVIDLSLLGGSGSVTVTGLTLATVDATDFLYDVI